MGYCMVRSTISATDVISTRSGISWTSQRFTRSPSCTHHTCFGTEVRCDTQTCDVDLEKVCIVRVRIAKRIIVCSPGVMDPSEKCPDLLEDLPQCHFNLCADWTHISFFPLHLSPFPLARCACVPTEIETRKEKKLSKLWWI